MVKEKKMTAKKRRCIHLIYDFIKKYPKEWRSGARYKFILKWSEDWGVSRKTIINEYVPIATQWAKEKNLEWQTADGQQLISSFSEPQEQP